MGIAYYSSLVPRPFPAPVFGQFQYAKMEGESSLIPRPFPAASWIGFVHYVLRQRLFSYCSYSEHKIGLLPSLAVHLSVTTCDTCAMDHVVRFTRPSPSVYAYCKQGLGSRPTFIIQGLHYMHNGCLILAFFAHL